MKKPYKDCYYQEPQQKCTPIYKEECKDVKTQTCSTAYKEECKDIPEEVCQPVERQKCRKVPMQECKMVDQPHCGPKNECTTKYEMKCKKVPGKNFTFFVISILFSTWQRFLIPGYDPPPHYGYIQEHCDYTPVEACKVVERCENVPEEQCKPIEREVCENVKLQKCQIKYERKCTGEPTEECKPTYKKSCQTVHKGDDCKYTKPRKMCRTLEREVIKYKRQRPVCIWPKYPESTRCGES